MMTTLCFYGNMCSQFGDLYDESYFIDYLKEDVRIVKDLPIELQSLDLNAMESVVSSACVLNDLSWLHFFIRPNAEDIAAKLLLCYFYGEALSNTLILSNLLAIIPCILSWHYTHGPYNYHLS